MKRLTIIFIAALLYSCAPETVTQEEVYYDTVQPEKVYDTIVPKDKPVDTTLDAVQ